MSAGSVTGRRNANRTCEAPKCRRQLTGRSHRRTCSTACRVRLHRAERKPRPGMRGQPGRSRQGDDWHSPPWIVEIAREALGGRIALDPASSAEAQRTVRAAVWYGPGSPHGCDGLAVDPWPRGPVWLNPPYGVTSTGESAKVVWLERLEAHYRTGRGPALALVPAEPSSRWARPITRSAGVVVTVDHRVRFLRGGKVAGRPVRESWLCGFGVDWAALPRDERLTVWRRVAWL